MRRSWILQERILAELCQRDRPTFRVAEGRWRGHWAGVRAVLPKVDAVQLLVPAKIAKPVAGEVEIARPLVAECRLEDGIRRRGERRVASNRTARVQERQVGRVHALRLGH